MNGLQFAGIGYPLKQAVVKEVGDTFVCNVDMAFNRVSKNRKTKEYETETVIMKTTLWGNGGKALSQAVVGQPVVVEGYVKMESWQDQEGNLIKRPALIIDTFKPLARIQKKRDEDLQKQEVTTTAPVETAAVETNSPFDDSNDIPF